MTPATKVALILAAAILIATSAMIWFSPYQTCVRAQEAMSKPNIVEYEHTARISCAHTGS